MIGKYIERFVNNHTDDYKQKKQSSVNMQLLAENGFL